jgi:hypothetical protein
LAEHAGPVPVAASAGFASAVVLLGTLIMMAGMFAQPESAQAAKDEPLGNATVPHFRYLSKNVGSNELDTVSQPVEVEVYVNSAGRVYDYRITSGPTDAETRQHVENVLSFSVYEPARFFGQPVRGIAVWSYMGVAVKG